MVVLVIIRENPIHKPMLSTEKHSSPLYLQIIDLLVSRISNGSWAPGDLIPSEIKLAGELGVSQGTVRTAITALVENRVLVRKQGKGTFVANHDDNRALFHFFHITDNQGNKVLPVSQILSFKEKVSTRGEAELLKLDENAKVLRIERVRIITGRPTILETIVLPSSSFDGMINMNPDDLPNTLYQLYENEFGITIQSAEEKLRAVIAKTREAKVLNVETGSPLLEIERVAMTLDRTPIELRISRCNTRHHYYENTVF